MSKNEAKNEKDELKVLKDRRDQCRAKITAIEEKSTEYRAALEEARKTAEGITKKIAEGIVNNKPLKDLKDQLTKVQNEVAFLTGLIDEFEGPHLKTARENLRNANVDLEENAIRILEPKRQAAINEVQRLHAYMEEIKRQWSREISDLSTEYGIGGFTFLETLTIRWEGVLPMGHIDARILAAARVSRE
jgi:vacuolar-type H+-ATPase subunit D/Vma8